MEYFEGLDFVTVDDESEKGTVDESPFLKSGENFVKIAESPLYPLKPLNPTV